MSGAKHFALLLLLFLLFLCLPSALSGTPEEAAGEKPAAMETDSEDTVSEETEDAAPAKDCILLTFSRGSFWLALYTPDEIPAMYSIRRRVKQLQHVSNRERTLRTTLSGMLLSVMLVLGYVESLLPSPGIPGIKMGLSNSVLIFAVYMLDVPTAYILMSLKVILSGLMFGGVSTMIYAFAGGLLSLTGMVLLRKIPGLHPVVVSMAGGLLHNTGQVVTAMVILHTPEQMLAYLGILMLTGLFCGLLTGTAASAVMRHLKRIAWHAPASSSKGLIPVILALLLIAGGLYYAWRQTVFTDTAEIRIETTAPVEFKDADSPPF